MLYNSTKLTALYCAFRVLYIVYVVYGVGKLQMKLSAGHLFFMKNRMLSFATRMYVG